MAFSSDGKTLALALRSGPEIRLHDLATGKAVGRLAGHREAVRDLLFSPDGEHLLSLDTGGTFILWRLRDRRELRRITAPGWLHIGIAFSPDGKTLAMPGESLEIRLREVPSLNEKIEPTPGPMNAIWPIGFAPDGKTLYSRGDALSVWDVASAKEIRPPLRHLAGLPIGLSPDGKLLAAAHFQHVVDILDAASGKQMAVISGGRWLANSWNPVGFSPDGRKLAALHARVGASIIDVRTWTRSCSIDGGKDFDFPSFSSFAFSPDSTTVALAYYNWLRLSELPSGKSRLELECAGSIDAVAFSPDGKTLTWRNQEGVLGFVEVVTGKTRKQLPKSKWADTSGIAYSPCGRLFLSGAQVWDVATGERIARGGGTPVFSADGRLLATADETAILIWETAYFLKRRPEPRALSRCEAGELFNSLKCDDAEKAHRAMERLMAAPPDSIRVLREQIRPVPTPDKGQTLKLIATLSSDQYAERQRASTELAQFGEAGWPILESQLKSALSLETRRRIELLLQESSKISPDYLRDMRAMEILERIGSPDAVQILEDVATGCPTLRRTREAKACLARLAKFAK
jgi:WD40 repeat protein